MSVKEQRPRESTAQLQGLAAHRESPGSGGVWVILSWGHQKTDNKDITGSDIRCAI